MDRLSCARPHSLLFKDGSFFENAQRVVVVDMELAVAGFRKHLKNGRTLYLALGGSTR